MITDPSIREQAYQYFLEEAPELLQTIEEELFALDNLAADERPLKINNLMRAAHTLKGGAANVGLDAINKVSHTLEDVFKALYNPDLEIDAELQTLLFENYECLRLLLTAELNSGTVDEEDILNKSAGIFVELQDKIGDYWSDGDAFPTSEELGLDVVESFFKEIIPERLSEISNALDNPDPIQIAEILRSQAEIFIGLAESLNLPGFKAISRTIITAIDSYPDRAPEIAKVALDNLETARELVLEGDRDRGGEPTPALLALASGQEIATPSEQAQIFSENAPTTADLETEELVNAIWTQTDSVEMISEAETIVELNDPSQQETTENDEQNSHIDAVIIEESNLDNDLSLAEDNNSISEPESLVDAIWGQSTQVESISQQESSQEFSPVSESDLSEQKDESESLVDAIWGQSNNLDTETKLETVEQNRQTRDTLKPETSIVADNNRSQTNSNLPENNNLTPAKTKTKSSSKSSSKSKQSLRINIASLERLNNFMGELLIEHNKNYVRNENIYQTVQFLLENNAHIETILSQLSEQVKDIQEEIYTQESPLEPQLLEIEKNLDSIITHNSETLAFLEDIKSDNREYRRDWQKQQQIVLNMRDELIETRMSPVGKVFNRFPHMLQQLASKHGKKLDVKITGNHILIDKAVEDKLYDPLLHIVRNAFDHGIETPEERRNSGKLETGTLEMRAYYQGSQTIIEVQDDGNGINLEKVKQRAIERDLISPEKANRVTPSELLEILFQPGFSTAAKVNDLSGRGVGLDVVRSQLEKMNGTVSIESIPGEGTTFSLQIPLTLTIAKLMLAEAEGKTYSLLIDSIERIILPNSNQIKTFNNQKVLNWETEKESYTIPILNFSELIEYSRLNNPSSSQSNYQIDRNSDNNRAILLLSQNNELLGLEVDRVLGERELVIRPVGSAIAPPSYIYGCSVLSDSSLTLVIDAVALVKEAHKPNTLAPRESQLAYLAGSNQQALPDSATPLLPGNSILSETLLVVDDSSSQRRTVKLSLEKVTNQVVEAENGLKGLEKLQNTNNIDLIVCDLEMPHMNGFQFLKALRQNENTARIPVIMLTSRDSEKFRNLAKELGASAYLIKPCPEQELIDTILKLKKSNPVY